MLLDNIFSKHEVSIAKNIKEFNRKNKINPDKYPILPLDDSFDKLLYPLTDQ